MPEAPLPPPETCLHNLHRAADRERDPPEPTDLCRNALGPFHMLDCPLFLGRHCVYYEEAARPHPATSDAEIAAARDHLRRDFLGWSYRQRVRNLSKPRELLKQRIALEPVAATADDVEQPLVLKVPVAAAQTAEPVGALAEGGTPVDTSVVAVAEAPPGAAPVGAVAEMRVVVTPTTETIPPIEGAGTAAPTASEMYPGQRRSEDRSSRKKPRGPRTPQFHGGGGAPGAGAAPAAAGAGPGDGGAEGRRIDGGAEGRRIDGGAEGRRIDGGAEGRGGSDDDGFGDGLDDDNEGDAAAEVDIQPVVPVGPKTVEEYLAIVPDARVPDRPQPPRREDRGPRGPGGGGPRDQRGGDPRGGRQGPGRPRGPDGRGGGGPRGGPPHHGRPGGGPGGHGGQRPPRPQGPGPGRPQQQGGGPGGGSAAPHEQGPREQGPGDRGPGDGPPRHGRNRRRRGGRRPGGPPREGGGGPPPAPPPSQPS